MARLINILAASIGGGVVLGAGIRMIEAIAADRGELPGGAGELSGRLDSLEQKLARMEAGSRPGAGSGERPGTRATEGAAAVEVSAAMDHAFSSVHNRLSAQQDEVDALRAQLASANLGIVRLDQRDEQLREELRGWVGENVRERVGVAEAKLQRNIENTQKNTLDALVEGVQTRVILRISRLEEEVAGQSAAMAELRECSLTTERSMQKLLEGIDRLVATQARPETRPEESPAPAAAPPSTERAAEVSRPESVFGSGEGTEKPVSRRWGLFR